MRLALGDHVMDQDNHGANGEPDNTAQCGIRNPRQRAFMQAEQLRGVKAKTVADDLSTDPQHASRCRPF